MSLNNIVKVDLGDRSYDINIGEGNLRRAGKLIKDIIPSKRTIIISDNNVSVIYGAELQEALFEHNIDNEIISLPAGENTKRFEIYQSLMEDILSRKPDRKTTLIALGGGVIGDLTGFAAATLLRGVPFIQIPTSLLAQVDSSVGGKTAINCNAGKNLIGSFYQPLSVVIDTDFIKTLSKREYLAGYAEILKYGIIRDRDFFDWLSDNSSKIQEGNSDKISHAISESCKSKAKIVVEDERESGVRALLNFGHTFGHALEKAASYDGTLLHGEAVAIGMLMAADLSYDLGFCDFKVKEEILDSYKKSGLPYSLHHIIDFNILKNSDRWRADSLLESCYGDKKSEGGKLNFILLNEIGDAFVGSDISAGAVHKIFDKYINDEALS